MGGKASKNKRADEEAKKTTDTSQRCRISRPTVVYITDDIIVVIDGFVVHDVDAKLCRTQSFRKPPSPPVQLLERPETSRPRRKRENVGKQSFTETIIPNKKNGALLVAAIDFGTTYTGYGYSFKAEPEKVYANLQGYKGEVNRKIPTVVLMNPNKEFHSFGVEAKDKYMQLMENNDHRLWYYFDRFKMKLFARETPLMKDIEIEDILGKPMAAIDVFAAAIRYIREQLLSVVGQVEMTRDTDIHWVLTVPAIWDDLSKQFMREAAQRGGIPSDMLTLALEPEAASLFCKKDLCLENDQDRRYILIDIGGGTADITCHELCKNGSLKELHPPTGGAFGGTTVDNAFLNLLCRLFGSDVIHIFKSTYLGKYWELLSGFEWKKGHYAGTGGVKFKIALELFELYERNVGESLQQSLRQSSLLGNVTFISDKMLVAETLMNDIFDTSVTKIKDATVELLEKVENIDNIFLVGGFSESPYLQNVMKEHFDNLMQFPKGPSIAVLKGASIYGHDPRAISSRKCKNTYGIARMVRFDPKVHPQRKKVRMGHYTFCDDAFCKHIEIGTDVSLSRPEEATAHEYYPSFADQRHAVLEVYSSTEKNPMFVDDESCNFVGVIKVDIDTRGDIWTTLTVRMIFGGTELIVEVTDVKNGTITKGSVDFLG